MSIPTDQIGPILGGVAAIGTLLLGAFTGLVLPIIRAWRKQDKKEIQEHFDNRVWRIVEQRMMEAAEAAGPNDTHVIRIQFVDGHDYAIPLTRAWVEVDPCGAQIQLLEEGFEETRYQLRCPQPYQIHTHKHVEDEIVEVQYGQMTDLSTGKVYRKGDIWMIPARAPHSVLFSAGTLLIITVRPPLPRMKDVPLRLQHLEQMREIDASRIRW